MLILFLIGTNIAVAQEKFSYNQNGLTPVYLINKVDSLSQTELFEKSLEWVKKNYKNPNEVIKATILNKMIRIEGLTPKWICIESLGTTFCSDALYTIEFEFKEGRYKFEVFSLTFVSQNGNYKVNLSNGKDYYRKNGKLKQFTKDTPQAISDLFNRLNEELNNYILGKDKSDKDW